MAMRTGTQRDYAERILVVLVHIQNHLDHDLNLDDLAELACFSPFHFHRIFRGMVGEPVREHIRRLRLERAALQLKGGELSITEVALAAGYNTHEAFTRAFHARFGQSPSDYRHTHQSAAPTGVHYSPDGIVTGFNPLSAKGENMEAKITDIEPMRVAFVRHIGPYAEVGKAWEQLCQWAGPRGLLGPQMKMLAMSHDDPEVTPPEKLRYDACIVVGSDVKPDGNVGVHQIPGGRYATTTHCGAYTRLSETYSALLGQWMPANDLEPALGQPALEFYLNDPQQTPEDELRTAICVPLRQA
jgi:AraC family transcriptional regulator